MKSAKEVTACVRDYGYFISLAEKLAQTYKKVYYSSPVDSEYRDIKTRVFGEGIPNVERLDNPFDPKCFNDIDLFIYPDVGFSEEQLHLRELGKAVWGAFDATDFELYRTLFLEFIEELKLPCAPYVICNGLTELQEHLADVKDKWIKVDEFRGNMETWHHIDYEHSEPQLTRMALVFGGAKEEITFIVQDAIPTKIELGYDGWTVDGKYPSACFQGYEKKNELYLGSLQKYGDMPKQTQEINEAISPRLKEMGYRCWMATEIRVKDGKPFFTDPTFRMPGQTGEQLLETCENLPDVVWYGANGILLEPKYKYKYAVSATMHYCAQVGDEWGIISVPKEIKQWVKPCHYGFIDGRYHFPPDNANDLGVVLGCGDSIIEALKHLRQNIDKMKNEPISFELDGFFDLLSAIRKAQKQGMKFSDDKIPTDEEILEYVK